MKLPHLTPLACHWPGPQLHSFLDPTDGIPGRKGGRLIQKGSELAG